MASSPASSATKPKRNLLTTANGKKLVMAITGLALCGFLFFHLLGNLTLLQGGGWFNNYAGFLNAIPFLLVVELGLAAIVFLHAWEGYTVWKGNKAARGDQQYHYKEWTKQKKSDKSRKSVASTTMMATGIILLLFMLMHVWHFKYYHSIGPAGPVAMEHAGEAAPGVGVTGTGVAAPEAQSAGETKVESMQLAQHVEHEMQKKYVLALYLLCLVAVALHLYHAVGSSLQTLGAGSSRFGQAIWYLGRAFAVVVGGGFVLLALWIGFFGFISKPPMIPNTAINAAQPAVEQPLAEPPVVENR